MTVVVARMRRNTWTSESDFDCWTNLSHKKGHLMLFSIFICVLVLINIKQFVLGCCEHFFTLLSKAWKSCHFITLFYCFIIEKLRGCMYWSPEDGQSHRMVTILDAPQWQSSGCLPVGWCGVNGLRGFRLVCVARLVQVSSNDWLWPACLLMWMGLLRATPFQQGPMKSPVWWSLSTQGLSSQQKGLLFVRTINLWWIIPTPLYSSGQT